MSYHHYYVNDNAQANGDHEVHKDTCTFFHLMKNRTYLGYFSKCEDAVKKARERHAKVNGCCHCSLPCHTT